MFMTNATCTAEFEMFTNFEMYTNAGDSAVYGIVCAAEVAADMGMPKDEQIQFVLKSLERLAKQTGLEEATDTAVREATFEALGFYN
jgi:3-dehydroquinate synthetase